MENVVQLNQQEVYSDIETFLSGCETESTRTRYERSIRLFFKWLPECKKDIEHLQPNDVKSIDYTDMKKFKNYLRDKKGYSFNNVNNTMSNVSSLFRELAKMENNKYGLNPDQLVVKRSKVTDEENINDIDYSLFKDCLDYVQTLPKIKKPKIKYVLLHIAVTTGIRKTGLLNLKFSDLRKHQDYYVLHHSIKGKKHKMAIKNEDAEMMLELKETDDPKEKIFKISDKGLERMVNELNEVFEVPEELRFSFHSIRRLSGQILFDITKDIHLVKQHLGHENINTSMRYVQRRIDLECSPSLYLMDSFDTSEVEDLEKDKWQELFEGLSRSAQYEILQKKKEMGL